jgi:hypothetical protein
MRDFGAIEVEINTSTLADITKQFLENEIERLEYPDATANKKDIKRMKKVVAYLREVYE